MKKLIIVLFAVANTLYAQLTPVCFTTSSSPNVGTSPRAIVTADFNGDGNKDIAIANYNSINVSILLGLGTGSFATAINYSVSLNPSSITAADFNNDGNIDLVTANNGTNTISVLLGIGTGNFASALNYSLTGYGSGANILTSSDFNMDGNTDLAVMGIGNLGFILLGGGNGTFTVGSQIGAQTPQSIITGNFNNDSNIDLAIGTGYLGGATVLLGSGTGTFTQSSMGGTGFGVTSKVSAGDFNNDGNMDLVAANSGTLTNTLFLGNGTGTYTNNLNFSGLYSSAINTGDFNGDGKLDVSIIENFKLGILLGYGTGLFGYTVYYPVGSNPTEIATADFNNDGKLDIAVTNSGSDNVTILINSNNGIYQTVSLTTSNALICSGQSATLTATGATSYNWYSTSATTNTIVVSPVATVNYVAVGTSTNGCKIPVAITQSVSACLGINEVTTNFSNFILYPNPANDILNVELLNIPSAGSATEIKILNTLGTVLQTNKLQQLTTQINIKELSNGIYFLQLFDNSKLIGITKIIKQ